jgi:hypothetical protein
LTACARTFGISAKPAAGIDPAPPPPWAFAAAALNMVASRAAVHIFNIFRSSLPESMPMIAADLIKMIFDDCWEAINGPMDRPDKEP